MSIDDTNDQTNPRDGACAAEGRTLAWLGGGLDTDEAREAERHAADCASCQETLAMIAGFTSESLDDREAELLEAVSERTAAAALALGREIKPSRAETVILDPEAPPSMRMWFGLPRWLAVAAVLAVAAGAVAVVWLGRGTGDGSLERGERLLAQASAATRPTTFRISGLTYAPARVTRGIDSENADRLEAARALFAAAVEANDTPEARHALGRALIASGDTARAVGELERASRARPDDPVILSDLSVARWLAGDTVGARADLDNALSMDPNRQEALFNRAALRAREGDGAGAREDLERLRRLDPTSPWVADAQRLVEDARAPSN